MGHATRTILRMCRESSAAAEAGDTATAYVLDQEIRAAVRALAERDAAFREAFRLLANNEPCGICRGTWKTDHRLWCRRRHEERKGPYA